MLYVVKRDGREVEFDRGKIAQAIKGAATDVGSDLEGSQVSETVQRVVGSIRSIEKEKIDVEEIQNLVEKALVDESYKDIANAYSSSSPYIIMVNRNTHKVGIFQGWSGNWTPVYYWDCTTGAPNTPTVSGVFRVGSKGYYFDSGSARCYWYTQFYGNYLFHSVLYSKYTGALQDGRLGMSLSHGCVRLDINNAKWIYENIPSGTTVVVY